MSKYFVHPESVTIATDMIDNLRYMITPSAHSIYNREECERAQAWIEHHAIEMFDMAQDANDRKLARQKEADRIRYAVTFVADFDALTAWEDREEARMSAEYMPVPWKVPSCYRLHFAHMSIALAGQIAYTKTEEHGIADRQTRVKPGRYLQQYYAVTNASAMQTLRNFGISADRYALSAAQIADYAEQCTAENLQLKMTNDPDEIVRIYMNGPRSCMTRSGDRYAGHVHPASVYGGSLSSFHLAYHGSIDAPSSRALVNVEKKTVVRVYPNNECALAKVLRANGYAVPQSGNDYSASIGNTIAAIRDENGYGYIMPYVDGADYAYLTKDGKQFVLGTDRHDLIDRNARESFMCQVTQASRGETIALGVTDPDAANRDNDDDEDMFTCANCNYRYHSDNMSEHDSSLCDGCGELIYARCFVCDDYIDTRETSVDFHSVYLSGRGRVRRRICAPCIDEISRSCESCGDNWLDGYDNDANHGDEGDLCASCAEEARNDTNDDDEEITDDLIAVVTDPFTSIADGTNITISADGSIVAYGSIQCIASVFRVLRVQTNDDGSITFVQCSDPLRESGTSAQACGASLDDVLPMFRWFLSSYADNTYVIAFDHAFVSANSNRFVTGETIAGVPVVTISERSEAI